MEFVVKNKCIVNITDYITLVKHVLLKIQLQTIKLTEVKNLQDLNYIENTKNVQKSHTQQIEEPIIKVDEITHTLERLILKN